MINVYLDLRDCPEGFTLARTFEDAVKLKNGYDFVKYFCEHGLRANKIYHHTDNPVGRRDMYETLLAAQRRGFIKKDIEIYYYPITVNKYSGD